jgi:hypothetical protein
VHCAPLFVCILAVIAEQSWGRNPHGGGDCQTKPISSPWPLRGRFCARIESLDPFGPVHRKVWVARLGCLTAFIRFSRHGSSACGIRALLAIPFHSIAPRASFTKGTTGFSMSTGQLDEQAILQGARKITDDVVRDVYLDQVCGGAPDLRSRVQELLRLPER